MKYAQRMGRIVTAASFDMMARGKALEAKGRSIIHLGIGEPDFLTPKHIRDAAAAAANEGWTHYAPAAGLPDFRKAIAASWASRRGIPCEAANVVVTPGAKQVLLFAMLALTEPGDEVIIPSPAFPNYASIANFLDVRVVTTPLLPDRQFDIDIDALRARINGRTRMLILNTPHNPTGGAVSDASLHAIAGLVKQHGFTVVADDIYGDMLYDGTFTAFGSLPGMFEHTITVDGFSKTYAMTGWRLGFAISPEPLAKHFSTLMNNSSSCVPPFVQKAGIAALEGPQDEIHAMLAEFRRRRDVVVQGLNAIPGVSCPMPPGAFYAFPRIDGTGMTSAQLADRLLDEGGVVTLPGSAFGDEGEGYIRISYANSVENLAEGVRRIGAFLAGVRA